MSLHDIETQKIRNHTSKGAGIYIIISITISCYKY